MITKEQVNKALDSLESVLEEETVDKSSETDIDEPEGAIAKLGNPLKDKLSDEAPASSHSKVAKADSEMEEDYDEDDEGDEKKEKKAMKPTMDLKKKAQKSYADELPEEIQTKIDVSEFLKSLVDHTGEVIDELRKAVAKSDFDHEARYSSITETLDDVQQSQAKIGVVLKAVCERIGIIERSPARPAKADTVAKSDASEREFSSGLAEGEEKTFKSLSENPLIAKSQIANVLCDLVKKGEATDMDVIGFESSGYIRPELAPKLKTALN